MGSTERFLTGSERYAVTTLPFIPFSGTGGEALNPEGVVAGGIANTDGSVSVAEWSNGVLSTVGVPPGVPSREFNKPRVFGINQSRMIVGTVHTASGDLPSRSFICDRGRFTVLPLADPAHLGGAAIGVNSRGEVVGYDHTPSRATTGWLWRNGVYSRLPVSGINTAALGINSTGTIIGNRNLGFVRRLLSAQFSRQLEGYIVSDRTRYLPGFVYAINDRGEAAGGWRSNGEARATVYRDGAATAIVTMPSSAVGINSSAHVVGSYAPARDARRRLFIWSAGSGAFDLTPDGYRSAEAAAINDRGDVLGFGETAGGKSEYFLLRPDVQGVVAPKALLRSVPLAER